MEIFFGGNGVAIPYKSGKYSYGYKEIYFSMRGKYMSQSLINQGNILTFFQPKKSAHVK